MAYVTKDEDKTNILPDENQLQEQRPMSEGSRDVKVHHLSDHELRFRRSLQKLSLPEWYKNSSLAKQGSTEGLLLLNRERQQRRNKECASGGLGRWEDLRSRSSSVTSLGEGASNRGGVAIGKRVTTPDWHHAKSSRESLLQSPMSPSLPPSPGMSVHGTGHNAGTVEKSSYFQYYYNSTGVSRWSSSRLSCSTTAGSSRSTSPTGSAATAPPAPMTTYHQHRTSQLFHRQPYLGWRSSERLSREKMSPTISGDDDYSNINGIVSGSFYRSAAERLSQGPGYYAMRFGGSTGNYRNVHAEHGPDRISNITAGAVSAISRNLPEVTVMVHKPDDSDACGQTDLTSSSSSPPEHVRVAVELSREIDKMIHRGNGVDNGNIQDANGRDQDNGYQATDSKSFIESDISPKSNRIWMESSFVGVRPIRDDSATDDKDNKDYGDQKTNAKEIPVLIAASSSCMHSDAATTTAAAAGDNVNHQQHDLPIKLSGKKESPINEDSFKNEHPTERRLSLTSTTLEEVLDSLLALPSSSKSPSPSGSVCQRTPSHCGDSGWETAFVGPGSKAASITTSDDTIEGVQDPQNGTVYTFPRPSAPPCPEEEGEEEEEPAEVLQAARGSITSNCSSSQMTNTSNSSSDGCSSGSGSSCNKNISWQHQQHDYHQRDTPEGGTSSDLTTATTVGSSVSSLSAELATNHSISASGSSSATTSGSSTSGSTSALPNKCEVIEPPPEFGTTSSNEMRHDGIGLLQQQVLQESIDFDEIGNYDNDEVGEDDDLDGDDCEGGNAVVDRDVDGVDDDDEIDVGFPPPPTQEDIFPEGNGTKKELQRAMSECEMDEEALPLEMSSQALKDNDQQKQRRAMHVSNNQMMDDAIVVRCSYVDNCTSTAELRDARRTYKTCHNCYTYYCSRECRKSHWDVHRHVCMYGRIRGMCKQAILCARDNPEFLMHLSRLARTGHITHGPGFVKLVFRNTDLALHFLRHGGWSQLEDGPIYVSWKDLLPQEMGVEVYRAVIDLCQRYHPETKFVLLASIFITREVPSMESVPHWEREVIAKCARLSLAKSVMATMGSSCSLVQAAAQAPVQVTAPGTLVLSAPSHRARRSVREACLANIDERLRERGVSIRHQFPDVYGRLCAYCQADDESGEQDPFAPLTIYPKDGITGQTFMCIIMPNQSSPPSTRTLVQDCGKMMKK